MSQALYRKYRSKTFDDVVGQDHVVKTLKNAVKSGKISHAYLFTGPRGVGKTSVARILAHEANGLDYSDESVHLDIIEIDAASNRRIDEIRDLRDKVRIAPAAGKYKVYIIDEVHMLTREAFNALLKTLEEPPAHALFILATTEAHKLPETIVSRTQRFEFKPINPVQAAEHLKQIAKKEKIAIDSEALKLLAEFGNGSFRDSIGYLDQLSALGQKISEDNVRSILGMPTRQSADGLLKLIEEGNGPKVLETLERIEEQGANSAFVARALSSRLRSRALEENITQEQIKLLRSLSEVSASPRPQEALEIALLSAVSQSQPAANRGRQPAKNAPSSTAAEKNLPSKHNGFNLSQWEEVLDMTKKRAASIYTALRLAEPSYFDGELVLKFQFPLHQKKLAQVKNIEVVAGIIKQLGGEEVSIKSVLIERMPVNESEPSVDSADLINNIFGSSELMEA